MGETKVAKPVQKTPSSISRINQSFRWVEMAKLWGLAFLVLLVGHFILLIFRIPVINQVLLYLWMFAVWNLHIRNLIKGFEWLKNPGFKYMLATFFASIETIIFFAMALIILINVSEIHGFPH